MSQFFSSYLKILPNHFIRTYFLTCVFKQCQCKCKTDQTFSPVLSWKVSWLDALVRLEVGDQLQNHEDLLLCFLLVVSF